MPIDPSTIDCEQAVYQARGLATKWGRLTNRNIVYANGAFGTFLHARMPERLRVVTEVRTVPPRSDGRVNRPDAPLKA